MTEVTTTAWIIFIVIVAVLLFLDIGVINRKAHVIKPKEAMMQVSLFIGVAVAFNIGIYYFMGTEMGLAFTTGYILELMLSVDNLFVFVLIFTSFCVPEEDQHKVLFYGIMGALVFRMVFIFAGVALVETFDWILYVFGAFLVYTGLKMAFKNDEKPVHPDQNPMVRFFRRFMPVTKDYEGDKFFVRRPGTGKKAGKMVLWATPMFIALIVVETTDIAFAVDSIPAILAITTNSFLVYSSNIFAVLGLRSMYFALSHVINAFCYLKYGLAGILTFVGIKMLIHDYYHVNELMSLAVIVTILVVAIVASLIKTRRTGTCPMPETGEACPALKELDEEEGAAKAGETCPALKELNEGEEKK